MNDGAHAYTYDGENRIRTVDGATAYVYDGAGQRVRKLVGENMRFVYGIGGQLIMEFSGSNGSIKKEYVYGGGSMATIAPNGKGSLGVQYLTSDHLGTPRVITKADGSVAARHDYKPFGEELFAGTGGRTTGMGYGGSDGNRQKFTGYERDNETGLDFAQARYNSSTQGRFTSPDSLLGSIGNPQSLNRYAYVNNNPMNFTDPTGHMPSIHTYSSTRSGDGGESSWDDPTSPQAVLNAAGIVSSDATASTQMDYSPTEAPSQRDPLAPESFVQAYGTLDAGIATDTPQNPSAQELVNSGTTEAAERLKIEPCADFFGGTAKGLKALNSLKFIADPSMNESEPGHPQAELQANGIDVKVNTHHVPPDGGGGVTPDGVGHAFILVDPNKGGNIQVLTLYGVQARGFVQLHETGHKAHKFGKTDYDLGKQNIMNGYRNNFKIWQACFGGVTTKPWTGEPKFLP